MRLVRWTRRRVDACRRVSTRRLVGRSAGRPAGRPGGARVVSGAGKNFGVSGATFFEENLKYFSMLIFASILMDVNLHFGRVFGPNIDVFKKFLLPDFELQLEVRSAKIVILPR